MRCLLIISLLCGILFSFESAAQNNPVNFESLSLQKGVSLNLTYAMLQDSRGYLWFGTMYGLVKYDGKDYTTYRSDPWDSSSISFDDIISLFEDHNGNIWVGTWGGGLNKLDPVTGKFTRYLYKQNDSYSLSDNIVWSINEDVKGNIWVGTQRRGINKIETKTGEVLHYETDKDKDNSLPSNSIFKIYKEKNGTIWVGSQGGLSKFLPETDSFENYTVAAESGEKIGLVHSILRDSRNRLLLATATGLYTLDERKGKLFHITDDKSNILNDGVILSLVEDRKNNIWAGTVMGLVKLKSGNADDAILYTHNFENQNSLIGNRVTSLMEDQAGVLWAAAYRGGVDKITDRTENFSNYSYNPDNKNSLGTYYVSFFAQDDDGNIWIVGYNNILTKFNPETNSFKRFKLVQNKPKKNTSFSVTSIVNDNNKLWIATNRGLIVFDAQKGKQLNLPDGILKNRDVAYGNIPYLLLSSDHKLWISVSEKGIYRYDFLTQKFDHYINPSNDLTNYMKNIVQVIYEDKDHTIWAGSLGGLLKLNQSTRQFKTYSHRLTDPESLSNDYVYFITEDSKGDFWIGTSNGLNRFDKEKEAFTTYSEKDGLPNNVIMSILEDSRKNLWISTNKGLARYDVEKKTFKNFDVDDGLSTNIFFAQSAIAGKDGRFYFGGNRGFTSFYPSQIKLNQYIPPVYITNLKAGKDIGELNQITPGANKHVFPYDRNFYEIDFASLDFTNPDKNVYKYKLEALDENWIYSGNKNTVVYTDLSPGKYLFKVMGSNSDGVWNEKPATLELIIQPPFWRTWWFSSLTILILLSVIYFTHLIRTRNKIAAALRIEKIREEENAKVRKQAAIDFHDELGHRLTRISLLTEIAKRKLDYKNNEVIPLLKKISENSIQLYEGTKDFIWAIDPQNDSLYDLIIRLKDFGDEIFTDTDVAFFVSGVTSELEKTSLTTDMKRHLALIFKEGMHNSLKHSHSHSVILESKIEADEVVITLKDDGAGFDSDKVSAGNGLKNMKKRAEKINGILLINSSPGKGTSISFKGQIHSN